MDYLDFSLLKASHLLGDKELKESLIQLDTLKAKGGNK